MTFYTIIETLDLISRDPYFILESEGEAPAVACYTGRKPGRVLNCLTCGSIDCEHVHEVVQQRERAQFDTRSSAPMHPGLVDER